MSLPAKLGEVSQSVVTWLLVLPCVRHRIDAGRWWTMNERSFSETAVPPQAEVVIVVGVSPRGAILGGLRGTGHSDSTSDETESSKDHEL